ncbi:hypothetical protein BRADI_2g46890v3 [Brachypodium distachyon]|uniref:Uncharacterized protein n=1 Tax=Brachypodium distachyon TaxID=15368 RepID=I1HQH9_BRADI|nr:hypothetical protein BRADI_2g46890v3 [Brachypodium distachyon]
MPSCWSSVLAVLGGGRAATTGEEDAEPTLRRRLLAEKAAAVSEAEALENLEEEVRALERALAAADIERDAAEARKREAEARADAAEAELLPVEEERQGRVEVLLQMLEESKAAEARIGELEEQIKIITSMTGTKWDTPGYQKIMQTYT